MVLRPATPADFAFLHALARDSAYAPFITDEDDVALLAYHDSPDARLLIWEEGGARGFALFCGLTLPSGAVELRRLALDRPGEGRGRAFIGALVEHAFTAIGAERLWLDASGENLRAQRAYARQGFTLEGRMRRHWWRPALGRTVDLMLYGLLREEWAAARAQAAG